MDDPILNCILAVCCPPERAAAALAKLMQDELGPADSTGIFREPDWPITKDTAERVAAWIMKRFDLAEKGTLQPLKQSIARLARGQNG